MGEALRPLMLPWRVFKSNMLQWRKAVGSNGSKLYRFGKVRGARLIRSKKPGKKFMAYCPALKKGYGDGATGEGVYGGGIKGGRSIGGISIGGGGLPHSLFSHLATALSSNDIWGCRRVVAPRSIPQCSLLHSRINVVGRFPLLVLYYLPLLLQNLFAC